MSENLVDDYKNLIPFSMSENQYQILWLRGAFQTYNGKNNPYVINSPYVTIGAFYGKSNQPVWFLNQTDHAVSVVGILIEDGDLKIKSAVLESITVNSFNPALDVNYDEYVLVIAGLRVTVT